MNSVKWELSQRCNLKCKHCFVGKVEYESELSLEKNKKIIDILLKNNVKSIMFSSKEPLMYENFIDILKYCRLKGIVISIVTNGTLFHDELYDELSKGIVKVVSFSLEGITAYSNDAIRGTGVFDKVMSAANELKEKTLSTKKVIPLALQISLTSINKNEVIDMHAFFQKSPFLSVNVGDIAIVGNAKDNVSIKLSEEKYEDVVSELLRKYSMSENPKYNLHLKGLNIYEIIYWNSKFDISLDLILPSCSAYHGYYSILPNSTLCKCVALKGIKEADKLDIYSDNILESGIFDPKLRNKNNIQPIKNGFCSECRYSEKCELCLLIDECEGLNFEQKCRVGYLRLRNVLKDILESKVRFKFKKMTYLEKEGNDLIVRRYYYTNEMKSTYIQSYSEYFEKIYIDNKFVEIDRSVNCSEIESDLENLIFDDALVFEI